MDRLISACLLLVTSPALLLTAIWIKLFSTGPLLFVQDRVGQNESLFRIYKFRTMKVGSGAHSFGSVTTRDDPRLIVGGKFLRKFKIDELPQLINVLNGTMALVGPRPTVEADYARMTSEQRKRAVVKPGLTGLAQINGAAALPWPQRIEFDLEYIHNPSIVLDLSILWRTLFAVVSGAADKNPETCDEWSGAAEIDRKESSKRIYLSPPHMTENERTLLLDAFDSNWIAPLGPHVDAFEAEFAGKLRATHAVALSSGTAALHLALLVAGVESGDVVLTSTLTFAATANAIRYVGAEPVFIDSDSTSWNMDPQLLEDELRESASRGRLPKAAIVVDICGQCADWDPILQICRRYGVTVIEDAAESLGATYRGRPAGTLADIGCFSFNGNKIITTSGGGMLVTENSEWAARVRHLATQARDPAPHYEHSQIGYNYRLSNILAAIGRGQLMALDDRVARRRANFDFYVDALGAFPSIEFMPEATYGRSTRWLTCLSVDADVSGQLPAEICRALAVESIEARPMWKPMHQQPVFSDCRIRNGRVADDIFRRGLCLPSGSTLSQADLRRIADALRDILRRDVASSAA
jgi:dTDP-4-amino-4,6-dideoxygalactose transaminase/lipopolysaccharide/colanic/teichoic acid biosynthesis glycosyltransferase